MKAGVVRVRVATAYEQVASRVSYSCTGGYLFMHGNSSACPHLASRATELKMKAATQPQAACVF
jgi:hypothetical protein